MLLTSRDQTALRFSLVFVWLATGFVSAWEAKGQGAQLLTAAGINDLLVTRLLIWSGAGIDAALGLAMWFRPGRQVYLAALLVMLLMTVTATLLLPTLWLHPLGPLTKNVPMAAILLILVKTRP
jgi:hypothetical protein